MNTLQKIDAGQYGRVAPLFRDLAAITSAAAVEHALAAGYRVVSWHCNADNAGSWRTALRVGFTWERDYLTHVCGKRSDEG